MSDMISRQAALALPRNKVISLRTHEVVEETINVTDIEQLPSVQPNLQPTCNNLATDCISRQAAIDAAEKESQVDGAYGYMDTKSIVDLLNDLPSAQPEPQWIPVSERLPEAEYPVIVTWMNNDPASYYQYILGKHYTGVAHYKNNKWYWYSSVTEDVLMEYGRCDSEEFDEAIEVIAWMPLPEPYKGGQNVE